MKISFTDPYDFILELQELAEDKVKLRDNMVRFRIDRAAEQDEGISFMVGCWLTAVALGSDGSTLLECSIGTGTDRIKTRLKEASNEGTDAAKAIRAKLEDICNHLGIGLRSGKIELF